MRRSFAVITKSHLRINREGGQEAGAISYREGSGIGGEDSTKRVPASRP